MLSFSPRSPIAGFLLVLGLSWALPAAANAQERREPSRVERQGSELVYRSDIPGNGMRLDVLPDRIEGVGGCPQFGSCGLDGITAIRVLMDQGSNYMTVDFKGGDVPVFLSGGGGRDQVALNQTWGGIRGTGHLVYSGGDGSDSVGGLARVLELDGGAGDDGLGGLARERLVVTGGPGNDSISAAGPGGQAGGERLSGTPGAGPYALDGGDGNDELQGDIGRGGRITVTGGAGDDQLTSESRGAVLSCGAGADTLLEAVGEVTDGCAPQLTLPRPRRGTGRFSVAGRRLVLDLGRIDRAGARLRIEPRSALRRVNGRFTSVRVARKRTVRPKAGRVRLRFRLTPAGVRFFRSSRSPKRLNVEIALDDPRTGDKGVSHIAGVTARPSG